MKTTSKLLLILPLLTLMVACGPAEIPKTKEIRPNETAYVIPLEGASKAGQAKFDSAEFLEKNKVAAKRIYLPLTKISTGRFWFDYEWIPTVRVITVDRTPTTFEWEGKDGIKVESRDSIGFTVGINISAFVAEDDTSTFLYHYPSGSIKTVLDKIIKSKATEILSREFAKYDLEGEVEIDKETGKKTVIAEGARQNKGIIVDLAKKQLIEFFNRTGVTITTFGLTGGLEYDDKDIQESINKNFSSELDIKNKINERLAQDEVNRKKVSMAVTAKEEAQEFEKAAEARTAQVKLEIETMNAEANLERAKNWNGQLPTDMLMLPANADPGFILDMGKNAGK